MATTLAMPGITVRVPWTYAASSSTMPSAPTVSDSFTYTKSLTTGTAINQADLIYVYQSTLAASTTLNLDLAGGLTDMYGATIAMARVKIIYVELSTATAASSITVGGHATVGLANWITSADTLDNDQPAVRVRNGGCFFLCAPDATAYAVTATTEDILKITNQDGAVTATIKVAIVGASA